MSKSIKANEKNLIKALRATAQAHQAKFHNWLKDDGQIGIETEVIPLVADVKAIVKAFTTNPDQVVEVGYGYTTIFVDSCDYKQEMSELDEMNLFMALPFEAKHLINWEKA